MNKKKTARELSVFGLDQKKLDQIILILFYIPGLGIVFLHVMVPQPYGFYLYLFKNMYGNFTKIKFSYKGGGDRRLCGGAEKYSNHVSDGF
jgi:hypothetical protein